MILPDVTVIKVFARDLLMIQVSCSAVYLSEVFSGEPQDCTQFLRKYYYGCHTYTCVIMSYVCDHALSIR